MSQPGAEWPPDQRSVTGGQGSAVGTASQLHRLAPGQPKDLAPGQSKVNAAQPTWQPSCCCCLLVRASPQQPLAAWRPVSPAGWPAAEEPGSPPPVAAMPAFGQHSGGASLAWTAPVKAPASVQPQTTRVSKLPTAPLSLLLRQSRRYAERSFAEPARRMLHGRSFAMATAC
mmetsp:Transcript_37716/g.87234  ORF Transcript_37716/g.87234 Transcript_37716/m.87234 type:complete len:172 (+) Transcript_37716:332-847(+)